MRLIFCLLILAYGCENSDNEPDCSGVACTLEFRTIGVSVSDPSGVAIPLDVYEVREVSGGANVTPEYTPTELEGYRESNSYPILTDSRLGELRNKRVSLEFRGFANGTLVASRIFLAGADCCHVALFQGDPEIVIE
ncbi:hypothetical protein [Robiginitalea sp. SC105]|uniref:hypothetical protein n=1 Tax=Robiginitalea sp. SC105 TaxID=2762332 RepID=UPI0016395969|nr:hypothetical protein [Robiginitalea sp. SC105]MBC2838080.1 hypothetical protein [Robiginitalea sp. SC105]